MPGQTDPFIQTFFEDFVNGIERNVFKNEKNRRQIMKTENLGSLVAEPTGTNPESGKASALGLARQDFRPGQGSNILPGNSRS